MQFYEGHQGLQVTGIDPNGVFLDYSTAAARKHGLGPAQYT